MVDIICICPDQGTVTDNFLFKMYLCLFNVIGICLVKTDSNTFRNALCTSQILKISLLSVRMLN